MAKGAGAMATVGVVAAVAVGAKIVVVDMFTGGFRDLAETGAAGGLGATLGESSDAAASRALSSAARTARPAGGFSTLPDGDPVLRPMGVAAPNQTLRLAIAPDTEAPARERAAAAVTDAKPAIASDLARSGDTISEAQARDIIRKDLVAEVDRAAGVPQSGVTFEVFSGKLKVDGAVGLPGRLSNVKIAAGEVNLYHLSAITAAGVATCKGLHASQFQTCVDRALAKLDVAASDLTHADASKAEG